jgi:hypothetical protein
LTIVRAETSIVPPARSFPRNAKDRDEGDVRYRTPANPHDFRQPDGASCAQQVGTDDHLAKPFELDDILARSLPGRSREPPDDWSAGQN